MVKSEIEMRLLERAEYMLQKESLEVCETKLADVYRQEADMIRKRQTMLLEVRCCDRRCRKKRPTGQLDRSSSEATPPNSSRLKESKRISSRSSKTIMMDFSPR